MVILRTIGMAKRSATYMKWQGHFPAFLFVLYSFALELVQSQLHLDGRAGLQVGVLLQGNRISYGNLAVDKFHRLQVSIGSSTVVNNYRECALSCVNNAQCLSFNVASSPRTDKKFRCELLNEDKYSASPGQLVISQEYHHYNIKTPCSSFPCQNNATCVPNYTKNQYHCDCRPGYGGFLCETDINECSSNPCLNGGTCVDRVNGYVCNCQPGYNGVRCQTALRSCNDVYLSRSNASSQRYSLFVGGQLTSVYCHMGDFGCGSGGWTTVIKMDGNKQTFHFHSSYWNLANEYNLAGGETGFDSQETKLRTYWNTPFHKICLGMKIDQQKQFIVLTEQASSLYSLIADGTHRPTSLGRSAWLSLIGAQASLLPNCDREGFNVVSGNSDFGKARIGILGNNENDCYTCDSRIGFGTGGLHEDSNTCGNGGAQIRAMGYILVQ